jgi:hypothetical protein
MTERRLPGQILAQVLGAGGRHLLLTLLALVTCWSGAQAGPGPGQTAPTLTFNKSQAVFGERVTATLSTGSCKEGSDVGRDTGTIIWNWPNGETTTLHPSGSYPPGSQYQFQTPPSCCWPCAPSGGHRAGLSLDEQRVRARSILSSNLCR